MLNVKVASRLRYSIVAFVSAFDQRLFASPKSGECRDYFRRCLTFRVIETSGREISPGRIAGGWTRVCKRDYGGKRGGGDIEGVKVKGIAGKW